MNKQRKQRKSNVGTVHPAGDAAVAEGCRPLVEGYVEHYNAVRLNTAIGYITPNAMLAVR